MASVPHSFKQERATVPPIVLPITSRGIALTDRVCWGILGVAMALAAVLILYLNRGTTFYWLDELPSSQTPKLGPRDVFEPHNGHLIATTRLATSDPGDLGADYLAFRLLAVGTVLLSAGLFYALIKRRIGALPALAPTFVLLFFGSAWQHVLVPIGFTPIFGIAAGLAALLALERGGRRGDLAACAAARVLGRHLHERVAVPRRCRGFRIDAARPMAAGMDLCRSPRAVRGLVAVVSVGGVVVPGEETKLSNVLLIPAWSAESLATCARVGLGFRFSFSSSQPCEHEPGLGPGACGDRGGRAGAADKNEATSPRRCGFRSGSCSHGGRSGALSFNELRDPRFRPLRLSRDRSEYSSSQPPRPRSARFSRPGLVALFAACTVSLATNIALLRDEYPALAKWLDRRGGVRDARAGAHGWTQRSTLLMRWRGPRRP